MVYVRSHKFCCCLPVRFGVFVMSLASLLLAGIISVGGFIAIHQYMDGQTLVTSDQKTALWVVTVFYTIMALVSLFGFAGCLSRKRALVSIYSVVSWILFVLSLANGAFSLYQLYRADHSDEVNNCINAVNDKTNTSFDATNTVCKDGVTVINTAAKVAVTALQVVFWLVQLYGCHIISSYVSQLEEEEDAESRAAPPPTMIMNAGPQPAYYSFSSPENSYGKA